MFKIKKLDKFKEVQRDINDIKCNLHDEVKEKVCIEVNDDLVQPWRDAVRKETQNIGKKQETSSRNRLRICKIIQNYMLSMLGCLKCHLTTLPFMSDSPNLYP